MNYLYHMNKDRIDITTKDGRYLIFEHEDGLCVVADGCGELRIIPTARHACVLAITGIRKEDE